MGWSTSISLPASNYTSITNPYVGGAGIDPDGGRFKLQVLGNEKAHGIWLTSDSIYKTQVGLLDNPLKRVLALKGHHYFWDTVNNPEMNFDENVHTGFIAQELELEIPHLVINQEMVDDKGEKVNRKSVNYIELIPYLVDYKVRNL